MSRPENLPTEFLPSILDRLIDPTSSGTQWNRGYSLEQMRDSVRRDLEDLLNSRRTVEPNVGDYPATQKSILFYGLPDMEILTRRSAGQPERIAQEIQEAIQRYEPRLKDIQARVVSDDASKGLWARIHIEAKLSIEPAPDVAFETILSLTMGQATVLLANE